MIDPKVEYIYTIALKYKMPLDAYSHYDRHDFEMVTKSGSTFSWPHLMMFIRMYMI